MFKLLITFIVLNTFYMYNNLFWLTMRLTHQYLFRRLEGNSEAILWCFCLCSVGVYLLGTDS